MSYKPRHAKPSRLRRRLNAVLGTSTTAAALLIVQPGTASAAPIGLDNLLNSGAEQLKNAKENLNEQINSVLPPEQADIVNGILNNGAPVILNVPAAPEVPAVPDAPVLGDTFDRGPCPVTAEACVDLKGGRSWLQKDGKVVHVAPSSGGAPAPSTATPTGNFKVEYKVKNEVSRTYGNAPMPNSVYFTRNGHAFHAGEVGVLSHGCIHLNYDDSVVFFDTLQPGDDVFIY
ncbi:L,D-transpeptidase [Corynebacterium sp. sy017]|uniref:L,D-transpeptidase n=1 Tax=unclassified Corynebacterium TaxID=2624378 RepID=UPI0011864127|nr:MULTISPECIES: L,D-transpeptidase [unclassified Corynebacterium]MBP3088637.1 L,D-transpeptidase [Corynebacterium sp. sy017]TSD91929.1 L,D-transpeptidase [Corynebacterium sp. SY003]